MIDPAVIPDEKHLTEEACDKIRHPDTTWRFFEYVQLSDRLVRAGLFQAAVQFNELYLAVTDYSLGENIQLDRKIIYPLFVVGRYEEGIVHETTLLDLQPDDPIFRGERALMYSRTGQYTKAEQDLDIINRIWPRNFPQFYHLFWKGEVDAAREYFDWLEGRRNFEVLYKTYGRFLLGDIEKGLDYLEQAGDQTSYGVQWSRMRLRWWCPQSIVDEVERHPRYQTLLKEKNLDDAWQSELIRMTNQLTGLTGIHVQLDEAY